MPKSTSELDYCAIGLRIKAARVEQHLSQETLAEKADLSLSHMSNIENGNSKVGLPALVSIANALNTTVDALLYDNIRTYDNYIESEIRTLLMDCTPTEKRILTESMRHTKYDILRAYVEKYKK